MANRFFDFWDKWIERSKTINLTECEAVGHKSLRFQ